MFFWLNTVSRSYLFGWHSDKPTRKRCIKTNCFGHTYLKTPYITTFNTHLLLDQLFVQKLILFAFCEMFKMLFSCMLFECLRIKTHLNIILVFRSMQNWNNHKAVESLLPATAFSWVFNLGGFIEVIYIFLFSNVFCCWRFVRPKQNVQFCEFNWWCDICADFIVNNISEKSFRISFYSSL